jgi:hypothetical protein
MSLTPTERERQANEIIFAVLEIITEDLFDTTDQDLLKLRERLDVRVQELQAELSPQRSKGGVLTI